MISHDERMDTEAKAQPSLDDLHVPAMVKIRPCRCCSRRTALHHTASGRSSKRRRGGGSAGRKAPAGKEDKPSVSDSHGRAQSMNGGSKSRQNMVAVIGYPMDSLTLAFSHRGFERSFLSGWFLMDSSPFKDYSIPEVSWRTEKPPHDFGSERLTRSGAIGHVAK